MGQTAPDRYRDGRVEPNIEEMAQHGPMAISIHGNTSDRAYTEGHPEDLKSLVAFIHSLGLPAGIGAHKPEVIKLAEERDFGADFGRGIVNVMLAASGASSGDVPHKAAWSIANDEACVASPESANRLLATHRPATNRQRSDQRQHMQRPGDRRHPNGQPIRPPAHADAKCNHGRPYNDP